MLLKLLQCINTVLYFPLGISLQTVIYEVAGLLRKEGESDWEVLNGRRDVIKIKSFCHAFETHGNHMRSISVSGIRRQRLVRGKALSRGMYFFQASHFVS